MKKEYRTQCRDDIMEYLQEHVNQRFSAADITRFLNEKGRTTNQTTVYRNLDKLTESGVLLKSKNVSDECCFYQYVEQEHHCEEHLHVQCRKCGKIIHLEDSFMGKFYEYVYKQYGFTLEYKDSIILGVCSECSK